MDKFTTKKTITLGTAIKPPTIPGRNIAHIWNGDSGSALFVKHSDGSFTQLALVSWSSSSPSHEGYDVQTNVYYYRNWINEQIGLMDSVYLQKSRALQNSWLDLTFRDMRHYLFRQTNLYSFSGSFVVEADVTLQNLPINHFVLIYDGDDIKSDKMIAMLTRSESKSGVVSSSSRGLTVALMTNDRGNLNGVVNIRYRAILPPDSPEAWTLECPNQFWACRDDRYCIRFEQFFTTTCL